MGYTADDNNKPNHYDHCKENDMNNDQQLPPFTRPTLPIDKPSQL